MATKMAKNGSQAVESPELKQARAEIKRLNEQLEQRVAERTRELEAANKDLAKQLLESRRAEAELGTQQEVLRKIFDHIPVMLVFIGEDGRFRLANREWERTLGWTLEEIMSRNIDIFAEMYPDPQDRQEVRDFVITSKGEWADFRTRLRDGRVIDTTWTNVGLSDGTSIGIGLDITDRKRTASETAISAHNLVERVKELTALHGIARILQREWPNTEALLGEVVPFLPPAFQFPEIAAARVCIGEAVAETEGFVISSTTLQSDFTTLDGQTASIEVVYTQDPPEATESPFLPEESELINTVADMLKTAYDRRHTELALRESEERFRQLAEHIRQVFWMSTPEFNTLYVSPAYESIWGRTRESLYREPRSFADAIHPDDRKRVASVIEQERERSYELEYRIVKPGGSVRWIWHRAFPISDQSGRVYRIAGIAEDITDRKREADAEREQRTLAEALRDTAAALNSTLVFEEVLRRILENVGRVVPHDTSTISLLEDGELRVAHFRCLVDRGLAEWLERFRIPKDQHPVFGMVEKSGKIVVVSDTHTLDISRVPQLSWIRSYISAPIRIKGEIIGVLNLMSDVSGFFTESHAVGLQAFADQAAIALENASLVEEVHKGRDRLQRLSDQLLVAQEAERRVIARELHDEIGQVLTAVGANLKVIELSPERATRTERLQESLNLIDEALKQVRDLALDLRPSMLDDFGLVSTLEWYIDRQAQRAGLTARFASNLSEARLLATLETTCFRVTQIALTNVVRHAGARQVWVELRRRETELELIVRDDGIGFDVQAALKRTSAGATLGLLSMQERVRLAGGELEIKSAPGEGTEIRARFAME